MNKSIWSEFEQKRNFAMLDSDIDCDVLIIGGGMAGVLTAHALRRTGRDVVLVEAKNIGGGITRNTTAVVTAQHDATYGELIKMHGARKAEGYLKANLSAVEELGKLAADIDCDFERMPSFMYSLDKDLSEECDVLNRLGYAAELTDKVYLPFEIKSAVKFPDMAQFHPLKFLFALADNLKIYENTVIKGIKGNVAYTDKYSVSFKQAVVATHFPFIDRAGLFFVKMYQERSYVAALKGVGSIGGTYIDDRAGGFYLRNYGDYLIVGKGSHRTGKDSAAPRELEAFLKQYFPDAPVQYTWANQDCVTLDDVPYVGRYGHLKNVYTLTGFNLWGMSGSMVGASILSDLLNGRQNEFAEVFDSGRSIFRAQLFKNLGAVLVNMLRPTAKRCPHLGCALKYNKAERSWDCGCHGSRFDEEGKLIDNPALKDADVK